MPFTPTPILSDSVTYTGNVSFELAGASFTDVPFSAVATVESDCGSVTVEIEAIALGDGYIATHTEAGRELYVAAEKAILRDYEQDIIDAAVLEEAA